VRRTTDITEADARTALQQLDPLWDELFPAEQARIVALLVERVDIGISGLNVRLRMDGLAALAREITADMQEQPHDPRHAGPRHGDHPCPVPRREARRAEGDVLPEGAAQARKPDNTLVKALARAFRWKRMLESGEFASIPSWPRRKGSNCRRIIADVN
jgi:hypothetical protein